MHVKHEGSVELAEIVYREEEKGGKSPKRKPSSPLDEGKRSMWATLL